MVDHSSLTIPSGPIVVSPSDAQGTLTRQAAPTPYNDRFQTVYGSRLSPMVVTGALQLANVGQMYLQADVLDEVREMDAHLQSVLSKREQSVAGAKWSVAAEDPNDAEAVKTASWCDREVRGVRNIRKVFSHMQAGLYHSHSVSEQMWFPDRGALRLLAIKPLHARRFGYGHLSWQLHLWDQTGNEKAPDLSRYPGMALNAFPRGKFLTHLPHVRGGYPTREGLGRTAVWYAMFKRWDWRDWMALIEWAGRGIRIGTYKTGKDGTDEKRKIGAAIDEDVQVLNEALAYLSSSLQVTIPDTVSIDIRELKNINSTIHEAMSDKCDSQNSKLVLGGTLTTDAGTHGARSLGDTQRQDQEMFTVSDAEAVGETFRFDTLTPMVRFKFGEGAPVPMLRFAVEPPEDKASIARTWKDAGDAMTTWKNAGVRVDMAAAAERVGMPLLEDDEMGTGTQGP